MAAIWDRQKEETAKSFYAFCIYRDDANERSLVRTAWKLRCEQADKEREQPPDKPPKSVPGFIQRWAARYNWYERVKAYDSYLDQIEQQKRVRERLKSIEAMNERHGKEAVLFQNIAKRFYQQVGEALVKSPSAILELFSPSEARLLYLEAAKLERLILGEPEQIIAQQKASESLGSRAQSVEELTDEELHRIIREGEEEERRERGESQSKETVDPESPEYLKKLILEPQDTIEEVPEPSRKIDAPEEPLAPAITPEEPAPDPLLADDEEDSFEDSLGDDDDF